MPPRIAIASNGLGRGPIGGHHLSTKFQAAAEAGFDGIELAWECLTHHAESFKSSADNENDALRAASADVKKLADSNKLVLLSLQPFLGYDALPQGDRLENRFKDGMLWLDLCNIMGIKVLQVPTCLSYVMKPSELDMDYANLSKNIGRLADAAAQYDITIAYEATAWGAAMDTWQQVDQVRRMAGRDNIKHCLDTFHIAAILAGDPQNNNCNWLRSDSDKRVQTDADELARTISKEDIVYFQVSGHEPPNFLRYADRYEQLSDAEPVDLSQKGYVAVDHNQPFNMTWSRNCRVFPYEGILPVNPCIKAVLKTGYTGWFSMEVFHTNLASTDATVPADWARRGIASWDRVRQECGI